MKFLKFFKLSISEARIYHFAVTKYQLRSVIHSLIKRNERNCSLTLLNGVLYNNIKINVIKYRSR